MISAAVIRALDGDMQARLLPRHEVKGDSAENRRIGEQELARCREMGIEAGQVLRMDQMARNDNVIFSATGITKGDLLEGISRQHGHDRNPADPRQVTHHPPHPFDPLSGSQRPGAARVLL